MRKKILLCFVFFVVLLFFPFVAKAKSNNYCLIENESMRILSSKNEHQRCAVASTTKILTALIAIEKGNSETVVKISENAANTQGSSAYLSEGDLITLGDLIIFCLFRSANDASVAIAEHIAKSEEKFVVLMNEYVREIGLDNTNFRNSHGLDEDEHYSSAYDMCVLLRHAMGNQEFSQIMCLEKAVVNVNGEEKIIYNKRYEVNTYKKIFAAKNGYTELAGKCLVSVAKHDDMVIYAAVMGSDDIYSESELLYEESFKTYKIIKIINKYSYVKTIQIYKGEKPYYKVKYKKDISIPIKIDGSEKVSVVDNIIRRYNAPLPFREYLGKTDIYINEKILLSLNHYSDEQIEKTNIFFYFFENFR